MPRNRYALFGVLAVTGCSVDLLTKHWVFSQQALLRGGVWWWWPDHVGLQLSLNEGALFGMGQGKTWLFAICSVAAGLAIPWWLFVRGAARDLWLTITLGCVSGGVLGNLYDRIGWHGLDWGTFYPSRQGEKIYAVRDFMLFAWNWSDDPNERIVWPNFNVADSLLMCGAAALFFISLRQNGRQESLDPSPDSNS